MLLVPDAWSMNKTIDEPDSVYLLFYATTKNGSHNGLHFAYSADRINWTTIGNEFSFIKSDYGAWGAEKKMISPNLTQSPDGTWHAVWSLNDQDHTFAHAASSNLIDWGRQSYPLLSKGLNCLRPVIRYDKNNQYYIITYADRSEQYYTTTTKDFKSYSPSLEVPASEYKNPSLTVLLPSGKVTGQVHRVAWRMVSQLIKEQDLKQFKESQNQESSLQDAQRFAGLKPVTAALTIHPERAKAISDMLLGIFFEDINYAADGGLYGELIQNRDFEYNLNDKKGNDKKWDSMHSWILKGAISSLTIDTIQPVHRNNMHYAVLDMKSPGTILVNSGFDGISVINGAKYNFSLFSKHAERKAITVQVSLVNKKGESIATKNIILSPGGWKTTSVQLTAQAGADDAQIELKVMSAGRLSLDMISLFPAGTFKGRKNGLRADLAQKIADIHPKFVRFPGGCVAHGDGIENIYHWKNTIGPLESRKPQRNLWGYHQTAGLGYFEYFAFCEDIGAAPVPVVAAGVPCQNSSAGGKGQQGGIPMDQMDQYVQDIIDLVEYANGDVTTKWGKKRAEAGHPKPFNLKYIGVGNEDLITDIFEERFTMIYNALQKKHPEITVIGTVGPFFEGTDYREGWDLAAKLKVPMVDEHYYQTAGWFINNQDFYDKYDRSKSKVYLGEYAASIPGIGTNHESALAEALYLTALERNGDVVSMSSYAPLLAKEGHTQWNPDLIYFNNTTVKPTTGYYVQQLFGQHAGNEYLPASIQLSNSQEAVKKRIGYSVVRDTSKKELILKIVNMLPVPVNSKIDLKELPITDGKFIKTVLEGNPRDKNTVPVVSEVTFESNLNIELPPYSFTVYRLKLR